MPIDRDGLVAVVEVFAFHAIIEIAPGGVFGNRGDEIVHRLVEVEVVVFVEAFAGGGIMAMLAQTMMPEAFEEGGAPVGLATIIGFLAAFVFTTIEMAH